MQKAGPSGPIGQNAWCIKARFQVLGDCLIPATTWSHRGLSCIPPLLRFARSELVLNVKELGCHEAVDV